MRSQRRMAPLEDRVMHDLVQHHREVEDREPLDQRERNPDQRVVEVDQPPGADSQDTELTGRNQECRAADLRCSSRSSSRGSASLSSALKPTAC